MKIGIVLLNYINYSDTIECINSLLKQKYKEIYICVVDNCSNNDSINKIKSHIQNSKNLYFIQNENNLGFSKGNNVGITFLRKEKKCDYVFVLNTDTIISDDEFFNKFIKQINNLDKYIAVINPMCIDVDNNFVYSSFKCSSSIDSYMKKMKKNYFLYFFKLLFNLKRNRKNMIDIQTLKKLDDCNYVIQGCSYFLTPTFFNYYDGLFPDTFLYGEELALTLYLYSKNLKTKCFYDMVLMHKEGGSSIQNGNLIKRMKKFMQMLDSYKHIKKLYKNISR